MGLWRFFNKVWSIGRGRDATEERLQVGMVHLKQFKMDTSVGLWDESALYRLAKGVSIYRLGRRWPCKHWPLEGGTYRKNYLALELHGSFVNKGGEVFVMMRTR